MNSRFNHILGTLALICALPISMHGQAPASLKGLMYVGTMDHKLLILDESNANVIGEIPLGGIPRITVLSPDQAKLYILTTQLELETVDLAARKVIGSLPLSDGKSIPRVTRMYPGPFSGLIVDPGGRYIYTTLKVTVKEIDHYRNDPPVFVKIDLQDKKIVKTIPFPKPYDDGFGFDASYKISPDGQLLYVLDDDIAVLDINDLHQVDRIELSKPEYPGASPYRLAANDDPNDAPGIVTDVFTSVDPVVHKQTLGLAKLDLATKKVEYTPLGPAFPMVGFALSPDRKLGYSLVVYNTGANRVTEWWLWDIAAQKVIKREFVRPGRISRFTLTTDGSKLLMYGGGSTIEIYDAKTLKSTKLVYLDKDTTTNLITLGGRS
jgi:DNA-binding beta-propeller fold protein YncE